MNLKEAVLSGGLRTKIFEGQSNRPAPLITVVTVVRNGRKTIERTILSVINQTYTNIEYIIVDGMSSDGTLDIIMKYEDKIDYWISASDNGIYDAMNKGIDQATGKWILMVNSDDCFIDNMVLEKICGELLKTHADIVHGNMIVVYPNGRKRHIIPAKEDILRKKMCLNHGTCFIRNTVYEKKRYNWQYKIAGDYDFLLWCYINNISFEYIDESIILFSAEGVTGRPSLGNMDAYKIWKNYFGNPKAFLFFFRDTFPKIIKIPIKLILLKLGLY